MTSDPEATRGSSERENVQILQTSVSRLKQEVDSIQIRLLSATKPWYQQVSSLVAVLALLFSFGTTYVSFQRAQKQDTQAARAALRTLLQRATSLPKENFEILMKFEDEQAAAAQLSSLINHENTILATQALVLVDELDPVVSASELLAAGFAAGQAGMIRDADRLISLASERATNFTDAVAALRAQGAQAYARGDSRAGQEHFTQALRVFSRFPLPNEYLKKFTHLQTENAWAQSELAIGRCDSAGEHLRKARAYAAGLPEAVRGPQSRLLAATQLALARCKDS